MEANTWNEGCLAALSEVRQKLLAEPEHYSLEDAHDGLAWVSDILGSHVREGAAEAHTVEVMQTAAVAALKVLQFKGYEINWGELHTLLCQKQHDYGHRNIDNFGMVGVMVRICDKIARAENLTKKFSNAVKNETIIDTYEDIVGYAVIATMLKNKTFGLELE